VFQFSLASFAEEMRYLSNFFWFFLDPAMRVRIRSVLQGSDGDKAASEMTWLKERSNLRLLSRPGLRYGKGKYRRKKKRLEMWI
jgi:hypothetical protein